MRGEVRGVFASAHQVRPAVVVAGLEPTPAQIAREEQAQKLAARQLEHAKAGRRSVQVALDRLGKVSKRL